MSEESPITKEDKWFAGAKTLIDFQVFDTNDNSLDITGWGLQWELRKDERESATLIHKTVDNGGIVITDAINGVLRVRVDAVDTKNLREATYAHALMRTDTDDETILAFGSAYLRQAATR